MTHPAESAFPVLPPLDATGNSPAGYPFPQDGLTKRELFAAMAMQAILSNPVGPVKATNWSGWQSLTNCTREDVTGEAVAFADALIKELSK